MNTNNHLTGDRRSFLSSAGGGFGTVALATMPAGESAKVSASVGQRPWFNPARAGVKRVVWLFMHGGPSHVDLFDPKPDLMKLAGEPIPASFGMFKTRRNVAQNPLLGPLKPFRRHGESGLQISDFLPEIASHADELCVIRSMHGDSVNHPQSIYRQLVPPNAGNDFAKLQ